MLRTTQITALIADLEIPLYEVLRALVDSAGERLDDVSLPEADGTEIEIVFHNDDITTMAFVMAILARGFDVSGFSASRLVHKIHKRGAEVVAVFKAEEARRRLQESRELARLQAMPLRITWRRRNGASSGE